MTDLIREYLNSKDLRLHGSNLSVIPGENGNVLSPGTFPGNISSSNYPEQTVVNEDGKFNKKVNADDWKIKPIEAKETGLGRVLFGGAKRAIQGLVDEGTELLELGGEQFLAQAGLTYGDGTPINLSIPKPVLFKNINKKGA